jgi:hypothetical protein
VSIKNKQTQGKISRKFLTAILGATPPLLVAKVTDPWAWALLVVTCLGSAMGVQAYADSKKPETE